MKKVLCILSAVLIAVILFCVFILGGEAGAYAWCAAVFIIAPIALISSIAELIILLVFLIKRKKVAFIAVMLSLSIIMSLPFSVLFGVSPVKYPLKAKSSDCVKAVLPIDNAVVFGGKDYRSHAYWPSECYAYDILKEPYKTGSKNLEDYGIFGCEVKCPVNGTVIAIENNEPDIEPNTEEFSSELGNYIVIRIDESNTYMLLAHLKQNSITVKENERVNKNQILGLVGNSGTSSEPHLHIQHQKENPKDVKFAACAVSLPIEFE